MTKNPIAFGFGLYAITMFLFFVVYYFFAGPDYFNISINVNAFGLTYNCKLNIRLLSSGQGESPDRR